MLKKLSEDGDKGFNENANNVIGNMIRVYRLIDDYKNRVFLKPWWKTSSEFNSFINANFKDDDIRERLCDWICVGEGKLVGAKEFRSELAKNVIRITEDIVKADKGKAPSERRLIKELHDGEFFVIQRSARFFDPETIGALGIAMKNNEILGSPKDVQFKTGDYYVKSLTNVVPQRHYYTMYAKNSFYVFSKRLDDEDLDPEQCSRHYNTIEEIFIFVAKTMVRDGSRAFKINYASKEKADEAREDMSKAYLKLEGK